EGALGSGSPEWRLHLSHSDPRRPIHLQRQRWHAYGFRAAPLDHRREHADLGLRTRGPVLRKPCQLLSDHQRAADYGWTGKSELANRGGCIRARAQPWRGPKLFWLSFERNRSRWQG